MGCVCAKGISPKQRRAEVRREKGAGKKISRRFVSSKRRDDLIVLDVDGTAAHDVGTESLISKSLDNAAATASPPPPPPPLSSLNAEKKGLHVPAALGVVGQLSRKINGHHRKLPSADIGGGGGGGASQKNVPIPHVPNAFELEHVAAGWPAWLASVAGDAIKGWVPRSSDAFQRLDKIGQGTYSNVYKARDLQTRKIVALKKVRFVNNDPESVRFMAREILVLRRLDHPNIVKLEGLITSKSSQSLYLIFEYMEHDLAGLAATPGIKFSEPQIKCYMQQLLSGLDHCHSKGVLHRDIKGSNLLIDNNGVLRIADFGLATFFNPENKQNLTSRVVTLWYRPPELLLGANEYGAAVDLWSSGCILAELLAGKPIMPGRTEVEQLHKIFKLCGSPSEEYWRKSKLPHATVFKPQQPYRRCVRDVFKDFPPPALSLLDVILAVEPDQRGTAASALASEFFTTKPLACDPSSLPKYPPSKEYDAKLRDEEARRQRAAALKGRESESMRADSRMSKALRLPGTGGDLEQQRKLPQQSRNSVGEKYNHTEDGNLLNRVKQNGWHNESREDDRRVMPGRSLSSARGFDGSLSRIPNSFVTQSQISGGDLSQLSGLVAAQSSMRADNQRDKSSHWHWPESRPGYHQQDATEVSGKQDWRHHLLERPSSSHKNDAKVPNVGPAGRKNKIHFSGPLMPPGGNLEEMLKEHERQIQQAVRRARVDNSRK